MAPRSRPRRVVRRLSIVSAVVGALMALRGRKIEENRRQFDLP